MWQLCQSICSTSSGPAYLKRVGFAWIAFGGVAGGSSLDPLGSAILWFSETRPLSWRGRNSVRATTAQSISVGGGHTSAIVAAYNDTEIKHVPVESSE